MGATPRGNGMSSGAGVDNFDYNRWLAVATRHARRRNESADLLHDALLDAIRAGRTDFGDDSTQRWFVGVLRNRAAMTARSAARRTKRERDANRAQARTDDAADADASTIPSPSPDFLASLPRSAHSVAVLALAGLAREEIIAALGIADTAFRQRLTTVRKAWDAFRRDHPGAAPSTVDDDNLHHPRPDSEFELGLIRRALLAAVRHRAGTSNSGGAIGAHDPDGHLIVIGRRPRPHPRATTSQSHPPRQQDRRKES